MSEECDKYDTKENVERVHAHTGMTKKNIQMTYLNNGYGKDKSKMLKVLSLGAMCVEKDIESMEELEVAIENQINSRKHYGTS